MIWVIFTAVVVVFLAIDWLILMGASSHRRKEGKDGK